MIETQHDGTAATEGRTLVELCIPLIQHWRWLVVATVLAAVLGYGGSFLIEPIYTAQTTLMPPERAQTGSSAALQSLGALAGLAGVGTKSTTEQFASMVQSTTVEDRLIELFKLRQVYNKDYTVDARRELEKRVRVSVGKKDGLLTVEVDDSQPQRAAALANQHVEELRRLTSALAVTEAQQRRMFFETQLKDTQKKLTQAQVVLQASGFSQGALKTEPKAAADTYAKLRAETTAAQVKLQTLRSSLTDQAAEVRQQQSQLGALQAQLGNLERSGSNASDPDYIGKYREFRYQETLLDVMARQYELARVDESREGALIQVVDVATVPEKPSKPRRLFVAAGCGVATLAFLLLALYVRDNWRRSMKAPASAAALARLRAAAAR